MADELPAQPPNGQILIYEDGSLNVQVRMDGETVWLTQRGMAELYQTTVPNINQHMASIYSEKELSENSTIKNYLIVQPEGGRSVKRSVAHYNLDMILAVGYRVRSPRGTSFRQWATAKLSELLVKGFAIDAERIKAGQTLGDHYFDELLEQIRDIRSSERLFYQKITDIYKTSIDYDPKSETSQKFFATVQNKLHWAIHGHTAAELIDERVDASKPTLGLTTWKNAPNGPIRKADVSVAKNYLSKDEMESLNRIVSMYLDYAEDQAKRRNLMHMSDWERKLDAFLQFNERDVLTNAGRIKHELAMAHANEQFEIFDRSRIKALSAEKSDFDKLIEASGKIKSIPQSKPTGKDE